MIVSRIREDKSERLKRWDVLIRECKKSEYRIGAEIGVWKGVTSIQLLKNLPNLFLHLVDPWVMTPEFKESVEPTRLIARTDLEEDYKKVMESTREYDDRVNVMRMTSTEASKRFEDESLDFVFIDANHLYEHVKQDIECWYPKVRKGGMVSGHDYISGWEREGVIRAVNEFFEADEVYVDSIVWYMRK